VSLPQKRDKSVYRREVPAPKGIKAFIEEKSALQKGVKALIEE